MGDGEQEDEEGEDEELELESEQGDLLRNLLQSLPLAGGEGRAHGTTWWSAAGLHVGSVSTLCKMDGSVSAGGAVSSDTDVAMEAASSSGGFARLHSESFMIGGDPSTLELSLLVGKWSAGAQ